MDIKHFFITKKDQNAIVQNLNHTLLVKKKSKRPSKIYLSSVDMKVGFIHDKFNIIDIVELNHINKSKFSLKSKNNNKYYCSEPMKSNDQPVVFEANRDQVQEWEIFDLKKSKRIVMHDDIKKTFKLEI